MTIQTIYDRFQVPPGLRAHMLRVTQFANVVASTWNGVGIDKDFLIKCALVHDLGNIVAFKTWVGEDAKYEELWRGVQQKIIAKYGADDHEATRKMLEEINADPRLIQIILQKSSANSPAIAAGDNWLLKILLYSDLRITPTGVASLKDKLAEMYARSDKHKGLTGIPEALDEVERQLQQHVSIDLRSISEADFTLDAAALLARAL